MHTVKQSDSVSSRGNQSPSHLALPEEPIERFEIPLREIRQYIEPTDEILSEIRRDHGHLIREREFYGETHALVSPLVLMYVLGRCLHYDEEAQRITFKSSSDSERRYPWNINFLGITYLAIKFDYFNIPNNLTLESRVLGVLALSGTCMSEKEISSYALAPRLRSHKREDGESVSKILNKLSRESLINMDISNETYSFR